MGRVRAGFLLALLLLTAPVALAAMPSADPVERRLVSFDGAPPPAGALVGEARVLEAFPFARVALLEGSASALARLAAAPGVAGVYEEERVALHLDRVRGIVNANPGADGGAPSAWPTGEGVTVAIVDSGLDARHPGFAGRVAASVKISKAGGVSSTDADDEGHGTHVAGILAGSGAMSRGERLHGIAPGARLVGVDISDSFTTTSAVRAFAWIHENREAHGIRVVSNSWGREKEGAAYDPDDPVIRASDALVADGMVVVFSAGNRGRDGEATLTPEAMNPNVVTVGSASAQGRREAYSSQGPAIDADGRTLAWTKPDLMAPGSAVTSTRSRALDPGEGFGEEERHYTVMNGTSMAAPQVAAAAALLLAEHPGLSPQMVLAILQGTARDLGEAGPQADTGFGMLDVGGALQAAAILQEGERRVVSERLVPVRLEGSVTAAASAIVVAGGAPALPPAERILLPLAVPTGGARVDLAFNWSGAGTFDVTLEGNGRAVPFEFAREKGLRLVEAVTPGAYRVVVRATGTASAADFTLEGNVLVREERVVDVPAEFHARPFDAQGGFYLPESGVNRVLSVVGQAPFLALALMSGLACVVGLRLRRR